MATLALSLAGQAAGAALGGPMGATLGRALGAMAGNAIDHLLFDPKASSETPDVRLTGSAEGGAIPRLYGWVRVPGNIIWASGLEKLASETRGAKGTSTSGKDKIVASFALGLGQGPVARLGRIWADGDLLDPREVTLRFYPGDENQMPDSLVSARQGSGNAPAYRGLCYIVFERLPLESFGNRIPNITVELCRLVGDLEPAIRSVTVIPGATEFGYDPEPRLRLLGAGRSTGENQHQSSLASDWTLALDDLVTLCPGLEHVSLVVSWFGTNLEAATCDIRPAVEARDRAVSGTPWSVAGLTRDRAALVSRSGGSPAYGGTPSDDTVRAAIRDLKARGLAVTLYPMLLMDIPAGNPAGQPAYPWRGRIAVRASADGTSAAAGEISAFMGSGSDWRYRRFIRHYAALAAETGCESLILGSELVGLTTARSAPTEFPFVSALVALAKEVRALAPALKLTYAADWTEYHGYQPPTEPGTKLFHLDPLWAAPEISAVGIDWYMPVADWRDGSDHPDAATADGPWSLAYLDANIAGGEGFDWYYASERDRDNAVRTAIRDGAFGEDWIWRSKDLASWWSRRHVNRRGGKRDGSPTAWQPGMKPVWLTELGAAAVDKAANQPNMFVDPKSAETGRPWFSSGASDALAQRQVLRAHLRHWQALPGMVSRVTLWTWDARPYPAFPARTDLWADAPNHATGHWLNGRLGALASDELVAAIGRDFGISIAAETAAPLIAGLVLDGTATAREALTVVAEATGLALAETGDGLRLLRQPDRAAVTIDDVVAQAGARRRLSRGDGAEKVGQLVLGYADRERDYASAAVSALRPGGGRIDTQSSGLVLDSGAARLVAESLLMRKSAADDELELALPPSALAIEAGDLLRLAGSPDLYEVTDLRDAGIRQVTARRRSGLVPLAVASGRVPAVPRPVIQGGEPALFIGQIPGQPQSPTESRLLMAAFMSPWPGEVALVNADTGALRARLERPAALGELACPLPDQSVALRHDAPVEITLYGGHVAGVELSALYAGANRLALRTPLGVEIIGFQRAELIAPARYRLCGLLRGLDGSEGAIAATAAGAALVVLDDAVLTDIVDRGRLGDRLRLIAFAGSRDATGTPAEVLAGLDPLRPLAPAHPRARQRPDGTIVLGWLRRSRADPEGWAAEPPLETGTESYRLILRHPDGRTLRQVDVAAPLYLYDSAAQRADFGGPVTPFMFEVAQVSPAFGAGAASKGLFNG